MQKIIILNGFPQSGKDTVYEKVKAILDDVQVSMISTVDSVKQAAVLVNWNGEKDAIGRKFLSDLKDLASEAFDGPYQIVAKYINHTLDNEKDCIIFVMVREPEEIARFKKEYPDEVVTVLVKRIESITASNHADANVMGFEYDYTIFNTGTFSKLNNELLNFIVYLDPKYKALFDTTT